MNFALRSPPQPQPLVSIYISSYDGFRLTWQDDFTRPLRSTAVIHDRDAGIPSDQRELRQLRRAPFSLPVFQPNIFEHELSDQLSKRLSGGEEAGCFGSSTGSLRWCSMKRNAEGDCRLALVQTLRLRLGLPPTW